jgi:F-box/WD-40 domain protein 9
VHHQFIFASPPFKGWVWCIKSIDSTLVTGSWDASVIMTDLEAGGVVLNRIKCKSAVLCMHCDQDAICVGSYSKRLFQIDPRTAEIIQNKSLHSAPVLSLLGTDKYVVTGSEDSTVAVYDRRTNATLSSFKVSLNLFCCTFSNSTFFL